MGARTKITNAFVREIKKIDGATPYKSNLHQKVEDRQKFWDEVNTYPYVCINAGTETREYQGDAFKWGFLIVNIKIYTKGSDCQKDLEDVMDDIEYIVDQQHSCMLYDDVTNEKTADIRLLQISTDEGVLYPIGVGEMIFHVRYEI